MSSSIMFGLLLCVLLCGFGANLATTVSVIVNPDVNRGPEIVEGKVSSAIVTSTFNNTYNQTG